MKYKQQYYQNAEVYIPLIKEMLKLNAVDDHIPWILYNEKIIEEKLSDPAYKKKCWNINSSEYYTNHNSKYFGKCIVIYPNLVISNVTHSDLRESQDQKKRCEKMKWNLEEYEFCLNNEYSYCVDTTLKENDRYDRVDLLSIVKQLNIDVNSSEYAIIRMILGN